MDYLLDTHTLIWILYGDSRVPKDLRETLNKPETDVFVSIASLWEIAIKHSKNPQLMPITADDIDNFIVKTKIRLINIRIEYLSNIKSIVDQNIHKDPFDHLLLAMAKEEKYTLLTHDETLAKYQGVPVKQY